MGNLTKNFSREEFACRDGCGMDTIDFKLVSVLQLCVDDMHEQHGVPVRLIITGPNRCKKHNSKIGGAKKSMHLFCKAADIKLQLKIDGEWTTIPMRELYDYFDTKYPGTFGLGLYTEWVHVDVRNHRARW